jgi:hypothetical protein
VCLKHEEIKTEVSPLPFSKHIQVWLHVSIPAKVPSGATLPMQTVWPNILNPAASLTLGTRSCNCSKRSRAGIYSEALWPHMIARDEEGRSSEVGTPAPGGTYRGRICSGNEQPGRGGSRVDPHAGGPEGLFRLGLQSCNNSGSQVDVRSRSEAR